jgi:hypothetical protein
MRFLFAAFSIACLAVPLAAGEAAKQPAIGKVIGNVPAGIMSPRLHAVHSKGQWAIISDQFVEYPAGTATSLSSLWTSKPQPTTTQTRYSIITPMTVKFVGVSPDERYLLLAASDECKIIYDIREHKDVTLNLDAESNFARWMGQSILVDQLKDKKQLLPIACYGTDGKKIEFPKIYGFPLAASEDGKLLIVGAFSENVAQEVDTREARQRAKTDGVFACVVSRDGKVQYSNKVMRDFPKCLLSPAGKFFCEQQAVVTKGTPGDITGVTEVRAMDGKVVNEFKGWDTAIGLLDDGRLITSRGNPIYNDQDWAVRIWENSKPTVLVKAPASAIVQHKTVYYIGVEEPDRIRAVEIP